MLLENLSFQINKDTIKLSYKYDATSGKSFNFIFSPEKKNWYLETVEYFLGEVSPIMYDEQRGGHEMYYELNDKLLPIYTLEAKEKVSIDEFSLIEAFKYSREENTELELCFYNQLSDLEKKYKSVWDFKFEPCNKELEWPEGWKY